MFLHESKIINATFDEYKYLVDNSIDRLRKVMNGVKLSLTDKSYTLFLVKIPFAMSCSFYTSSYEINPKFRVKRGVMWVDKHDFYNMKYIHIHPRLRSFHNTLRQLL